MKVNWIVYTSIQGSGMPPQIQITPFSTFAKSFKATSHAPPEFGPMFRGDKHGIFGPIFSRKEVSIATLPPSSSFLGKGKTPKKNPSKFCEVKNSSGPHLGESGFFNKLRVPIGLASVNVLKEVSMEPSFKHMNLWTLWKLLEGSLWTTPIETGQLFEHQSFRSRKFRPHVKLKWKWHKFKHFGMSWYVSCAEVLLMPRPTKGQWQVNLFSPWFNHALHPTPSHTNLYLSCIYRLYACLLTRAILKLHGRIGFWVRKWSDIWVAATSASASLENWASPYPVPSQ